jgi:hypothetical protein
MYMSFMSDWLMMVVLCIQTPREREWMRERDDNLWDDILKKWKWWMEVWKYGLESMDCINFY